MGVEAVLKKLQGDVIRFADIAGQELAAMWFVGGYRNPKWVDAAIPDGWKAPAVLVVQDLFASKLTAAAALVLPATTAYEKDGTFVNHAGYAQPFPRAVKPGVEVRGELQTAFDLTGKKGLATAAAVRAELARELPQFAALAELSKPGEAEGAAGDGVTCSRPLRGRSDRGHRPRLQVWKPCRISTGSPWPSSSPASSPW